MPFGLSVASALLLVVLAFLIATTVNTFAMEAAVLFTPAFLYVFPVVVAGFPSVEPNAAIGLALYVELFGYSSSVAAYWFRHQIDFHIAGKLLVITVPMAVLARFGSYLIPSNALMLLFGGLLLVLAFVLYEAHAHGPSVMDRVMEMPVTSLSREDLSRLSGTSVPDDYQARTRVTADAAENDGGSREGFHMEPLDTAMTVAGGALAGLVGIAVGELAQTMLTVRKRISVQLSTGTSALVLHVTVVAALITNVLLLRYAPAIAGEGFTVPFGVGTIAAIGCLFGGQMGAYLNNRMSEETVIYLLMTVYALVGVLVTVNTVLLGGAGH